MDRVAGIKIKEIKDLKTILECDKFPKSFLPLLKQSHSEELEYEEKRHIEKAAIGIFSEFFGDFLRQNKIISESFGININNELYVYDKGTKIIPGRDILDGYITNLYFEFGEEKIEVNSLLERKGTWELRIIEDVLKKMNLNGNGINSPRLKFYEKNRDNITVVGFQLIPLVIATMQEIYRRIGNKMDELKDLKENSEKEGNATFGKGIGKISREILSREYNERLRYVTPEDWITSI